MNNLALSSRPVSSGYRVDISRGKRIGRVSSEWFSRPDDERFLSLGDLHDAVRSRADRARTRVIDSTAIRVEADRSSAERLSLILPGSPEPVVPTHWSFGQLCGMVGAPTSYMRQLPAPLAGINLQHGLLNYRGEQVKTMEMDDGRVELGAVTSPDYGRIRRPIDCPLCGPLQHRLHVRPDRRGKSERRAETGRADAVERKRRAARSRHALTGESSCLIPTFRPRTPRRVLPKQLAPCSPSMTC